MTRPTGSRFNRPGADDEQFTNLSPRDVANIHVTSDKDSRAEAIHHTLGQSGYQASPGDHAHDGITSPQIPVANLPVAAILALLIPTGTVWVWAGPYTTVPTGWCICDGREVGRTDPVYAALYAAIQTNYGSLGAGTFSIPDGRGKAIYGYTGGLPSFNQLGKTGGSETMAHTHTVAVHSHPLGDTGWAQIVTVAASPAIFARRISATSWQANLSQVGTAFASASAAETLGTALDGTTGNNTTPTGTGAASNSNALSPYITMNYMIKL
jgi:microcystin-dependent protein